MIAYLNGVVDDKSINTATIDVNGVGYGVYLTSDDISALVVGNQTKVYIYEYVREQAYDLYGFTQQNTKQLFEKLLDVNGVGPRMALNMLSVGPVEKVKRAIAEGDVKYLQQAQGVGKRVAERVVVDLKDKIGLFASDDATAFLQEGAEAEDEAVQALMGLGFSANDATKALQGIDKDISTEERIRVALKGKK